MKYSGLQAYMSQFQDETGLQVVIKDFVGLFELENDLFNAVHEFYVHKQSFCMAVKENPKLWHYCLVEKELIFQRLKREPIGFYGNCYAGIREYILPIMFEERVIGALAIGCFKTDEEIRLKKWDQLAARYQCSKEVLIDTYDASTICWSEELEPYIERLQVVAEYVGLAYGAMRNTQKSGLRVQNDISRHYILSHAVEYLKIHFKEEISLEMLAQFCHCSKSYISHQFKKHTQMTLRTYINQMRIDAAKILLKSGVPVTVCAFDVGFKDSNYFSKVFRELEGITPTEYGQM